MTTHPRQSSSVMTSTPAISAPNQERVDREIDALLASLPDPGGLTAAERRGIIARYTAVLEGNFIYWMTASDLAVASDEAHAIIHDNLLEEVRDNHPGMLRRFAMAAHAVPTDTDAFAVHRQLQAVRHFVSRLSAPKLVLMMAFFEGFICKFMPYLADLAARQGSTEMEYTDVHGVVDVGHTQGLFRALDAELTLLPSPLPPSSPLLEGVEVLRTLLQAVVLPGVAA